MGTARLEVVEPDGLSHTRGAWGILSEAHDLVGTPQLELSKAATLLESMDQRAGLLDVPRAHKRLRSA